MNQRGFTLFELISTIVIIALAAGWVMNIYKLSTICCSDPVTGWFIIRAIGVVVAPIGAIVGWM